MYAYDVIIEKYITYDVTAISNKQQ